MFDFGKGYLEPAHQHPNGGGWVADTAFVEDTCFVGPYATVYDNAQVSGNVKVNDYAKIYGDAVLMDNVKVYGNAEVFDNAKIKKNARVCGNAIVYGKALVTDNSSVFDNAEVYDEAILSNYSQVYENARVYKNVKLRDYMKCYNRMVMTRTPKIVEGFFSTFIITDHHVSIGCFVLPPELMIANYKEILQRNNYDKETKYDEEFLNGSLEVIKFLIDTHKCVSRQEDLEYCEKNNIVQLILDGKSEDYIMSFEERKKTNRKQSGKQD